MTYVRMLLALSVVAVSVAGVTACHRASTPRAPASGVSLAAKSGMVPVDDVQIHYEIHGDGAPLILLHGGLGHAGSWDKQIPALSTSYRVIAIDSRGHGRSTYSEQQITYALMASDVIAVMGALEIRKAHVLGWSDGANTGLDLAINHPERVNTVVAFGGNADPSGLRADFVEHATVQRYIESASADYLRLSPNPEQWDAFLANVERMWSTEPNFTKDQLGSIIVPILILDGDHDEAVYTAHTRTMAGSIPTSTLTLMSGTGHFAHWEQPEEFNEIVLGFLEGISDTGSPHR